MTNLSKYPVGTPELTYWMGERGIDREVLEKQYLNVMQHIEAVQEAGEKLGISAEQLSIHDLSKFSREEFGAYALHFQGGGAPKEFAFAWLHHLHANAHHPEHWRFSGEYNPNGSDAVRGCLPMPHHYLMENIADWMGASMVYAQTDDMTDWLAKNMGRMYYHPDSAASLRAELSNLGYKDVVSSHKFGSETGD